MLADLDQTLNDILKVELPIKNSEIDVKFDQPAREWSAKLSKPTLNLFLYDLRENNTLRQHGWQVTSNNGRSAEKKRLPLRIDAHYMITAWASDPEDEHRLLTRTLLALSRHAVIDERWLVGSLQNPSFPIQTRLASHDKLTNPAEVWSALDNELRPTVSYIVTLSLDPWTFVEGPVVRSYTLRTGQAEGLPYEQQLIPGTEAMLQAIGGTVLAKEEPQAGLSVALQGTGFMSETDNNGRYALAGVPDGEYTLLVWPEKGKPKQKKVRVPGGDYDVEI